MLFIMYILNILSYRILHSFAQAIGNDVEIYLPIKTIILSIILHHVDVMDLGTLYQHLVSSDSRNLLLVHNF